MTKWCVMSKADDFRYADEALHSAERWYVLMWLTTFVICASLSYYALLFI